ncbi:hypothetical protein Btru_055669 [Bulinus truncatus]|nr:hypothetical protein Btru_055669 [Bulinus truncatus]
MNYDKLLILRQFIKLSVEVQGDNQFRILGRFLSLRMNPSKRQNFHEYLCSPRNRLCELYPQNLVKVTNATAHVKLTNLYTCSYLVTISFHVVELKMDAEASVSIATLACQIPPRSVNASWGSLSIEWNKTQKLTVRPVEKRFNSFLTCSASCSADSQRGRGDDDYDRKG